MTRVREVRRVMTCYISNSAESLSPFVKEREERREERALERVITNINKRVYVRTAR